MIVDLVSVAAGVYLWLGVHRATRLLKWEHRFLDRLPLDDPTFDVKIEELNSFPFYRAALKVWKPLPRYFDDLTVNWEDGCR